MEGNFTSNISFLTAFAAGLLSFLSPCVLPLIPGYISFISGASLQELTGSEDIKAVRRKVINNSIAFVLGFSVIFILLGASATAISRLLLAYIRPISIAAGAVIVVIGLHTAGIFKIPLLYVEKRFQTNVRPANVFGSFVIGLAFAFGWTPCIGPILAGILGIAAAQDTVWKGILLLAAYSLGLGIPFMITAYSITFFMKTFEKIKKHMNVIEWITGGMLVIIGILMMTGGLSALAGSFDFFNRFSK